MPFTLTEAHLRTLFEAANFDIPPNQMIFIGLRGCVPLELGGTEFRAQHDLEYLGTDHLHFRCTFVQWKQGAGIAVFPGSTVPHLGVVKSHIAQGGRGVNQLALGYYRDAHAYYKGDHKLTDPSRRHRAFRNDSILPVWRTGDDEDYDGDDRLDTVTVPGDNIHCAWQTNPAAATFSSNGCQVIVGRPRVAAREWNDELGPWAKFIANAYAVSQQRFCYALFSGREFLRFASGPAAASVSPTLRFGSRGELVEVVQDALIKHGYDLGAAGADGDFGLASLMALRLFQIQQFGAGGVDLIAGPSTAEALGIAWPKLGGATPALIEPVAAPQGPAMPVPQPASAAGSAAPSPAASNYRSLTQGGAFSADPFDLSVKRSIRTNNPGALNISAWQKNFPGFAGITQPDNAGNRTTIYVTPEHGIGAWHFLLTDRYGFGAAGKLVLEDLARRYAGVPSTAHPAVKGYVAGWRKWSGNVLTATSTLALDDDQDMLALARGMFGHEIGGTSPLTDPQIINGLKLKRTAALPKS